MGLIPSHSISIDLVTLLILILLGFVIGFVGGMVGLVLGVLRLPFLILGVESSLTSITSVSVAAGTNIGVSTFGATAAAIRHFQQRNFYFRTFIIMGVIGAIAAFLGSLLTRYVPVTTLFSIIAIIVLYEAFVIIRSSRKKNENVNKERSEYYKSLNIVKGSTIDNKLPYDEMNISKSHNHHRQFVVVESFIGFGIGFLGGLVGLILGSIRLPIMISTLKMEPKVAIGTNLAASSLMCASSLAGHIINGNVDFLIVITMGPAAMIGGYLGAKYTDRFSERSLKLIIGIVLVAVAAIMLWRVYYEIS